MKRLYVVTVTLEYAALADSEDAARKFVRDAVRDDCMYEDGAEAKPAKAQRYCLPAGWEGDALVYGANGDITWDAAVEAEKTSDAEAKRLADFEARQMLPIGEKL